MRALRIVLVAAVVLCAVVVEPSTTTSTPARPYRGVVGVTGHCAPVSASQEATFRANLFTDASNCCQRPEPLFSLKRRCGLIACDRE
jgi:hypothetical protein